MALWTLHGNGTVQPGAVVAPDERLGWGKMLGLGAQHVVAMFGATFLVPLITGFPVTTTLFFSGLGTLLFLLITGNRLPSYLGSSFAFISPVWHRLDAVRISARHCSASCSPACCWPRWAPSSTWRAPPGSTP